MRAESNTGRRPAPAGHPAGPMVERRTVLIWTAVRRVRGPLCWQQRVGWLLAQGMSRSITRDEKRAGRQFPMLVLTRKTNQSIMIGDDIEVSVLAIMGEKVRIGIQAPRDIPVFRKEVYLEIQEEQKVGAPKGAREEVDAALRGLGDSS